MLLWSLQSGVSHSAAAFKQFHPATKRPSKAQKAPRRRAPRSSAPWPAWRRRTPLWLSSVPVLRGPARVCPPTDHADSLSTASCRRFRRSARVWRVAPISSWDRWLCLIYHILTPVVLATTQRPPDHRCAMRQRHSYRVRRCQIAGSRTGAR